MNPFNLPARVYAGIRGNPGQSDRKPDTSDAVDSGMFITARDRQIQVSGVGEVSVPPDRFSLTIRISSKKDNVQDAKNSVTRRLDYVRQTLTNHNVQESDQEQYKHMQRVESMVHLDVEIRAQFADLQRCQAVANLLVEKLDSSVSVSLPECSHSKNSLQVARKKSSLMAIHNAKEKAKELARFVHLIVGRPINISETETKEWETGQPEEATDPDHFLAMQNKMQSSTINIRSQVTMCFELKSKGKTKTPS
ncbi:interleukin-1 receptor-associated kinase 1-binding protein 1-like [Babylonia areolata]|uniref:interleukin-1 receptor-associated kinase 1-binding protein 1-like n=1 Tax=Babylonia areolata TaxID=304850 RepID=UPI003FD0BDC1